MQNMILKWEDRWILDEVNMYFPIGSFRNFPLPIEDPYEIIFIRATRDRLKLVVLTQTVISIWLTKVNKKKSRKEKIDIYFFVLANYISWSCSTVRKFNISTWWKCLCGMAKWYSKISCISMFTYSITIWDLNVPF
jgi:hypothetical protein